MTYLEFLESKRHRAENFGIDVKWMPDGMFDYQRYVTEYAVKKGRCAVFLDTGLGKTLIEITIAVNYLRHTNKPVLILAPLAVKGQTLNEAKRFGIDTTNIVIQNYEQLDNIDCSIFSYYTSLYSKYLTSILYLPVLFKNSMHKSSVNSVLKCLIFTSEPLI